MKLKWTTISAVFGTIVIVIALTLKLVGVEMEWNEAEVSTDITIEAFDPNGNIDWGDSVFLEVTLTNEPNFTDSDRVYLYEGDEFNIVIERKEPNEPEFMLIHPPETNHVWKCSCGEGFGEMLEVSCSCGKIYKTFDILMKSIPTWPEYIELDKDLVIIWPKTRVDGLEWDYQPSIEMSKGTKIYFKE